LKPAPPWARIQAWKAVDKALGVLPAPAAVPFLTTRISAALKSANRPSSWLERLLVPASALVVALLGFWLGTLAAANSGSAAQDKAALAAVASTAYIDTFDAVPTASLGDAYFALAASGGGDGK